MEETEKKFKLDNLEKIREGIEGAMHEDDAKEVGIAMDRLKPEDIKILKAQLEAEKLYRAEERASEQQKSA